MVAFNFRGYELVNMGPTAEEKFLTNYVLERSDGILPLYGFPSWFLTSACVIPSYLIAWFLVFVIAISGHRSFGLILYGLAPMATILLTITVIAVGVNYANAANQLDLYANRFYATFSTIVPVDRSARDQFEVRPLIWGWLSSFVHLSQALNLWTGIFPMLGKWSGTYGKRTYLGWIPLLVLWQLLIQLPVLLIMFAMASSYDPDYARCHLSTNWQAPFLIMSHVFSKFSSDRLLAGCFFIALVICMLLSQSLLLLTSMRNFTDFVTPPNSASSRRQRCAYRTALSITVAILLLIGLPMVTRAGFYWIRLVDWYVDRMLVIVAPLQAIGYVVAYVKSGGRYIQKTLLRLGLIVGSAILISVSVAVYLWYLIAATEPSPDTNCPTYSRAPENDPIHSNFRFLGWSIAVGPVLLGLLLTVIAVAHRSCREKKSFFMILLWGDDRGPRYSNPYQPCLRMPS
ncbi:hypothetical protein D915_004704 [Fasciola hepatica]|uniref:Uncharacterized protein n=1 Tax=Fasciola hepatica TaxID=6192 RepID=A0A4E0RBJ8_FASHE|nr:hypothetical protein D915_004704 [Fasciola hepatica]